MAKRFTDTDKWKRPWFRGLNNKARWSWIYLLDTCDHAGVWIADFETMSIHVGFKIRGEDLIEWFGEKIIQIDADKFFIPSFIEFQYGQLQKDSRPHQSVIKSLVRIGIDPMTLNLIKEYPKSLNTLKEQEQYKEQDKVKDKEQEEEGQLNFEILFAAYPNKVGKAEGLKRLQEQIKSQQDFIDFRKATENYQKFLDLDKNKGWMQAKQFDVFVGPKSKENKPWREWVNPDPSVFGELNNIRDVMKDFLNGV